MTKIEVLLPTGENFTIERLEGHPDLSNAEIIYRFGFAYIESVVYHLTVNKIDYYLFTQNHLHFFKLPDYSSFVKIFQSKNYFDFTILFDKHGVAHCSFSLYSHYIAELITSPEYYELVNYRKKIEMMLDYDFEICYRCFRSKKNEYIYIMQRSESVFQGQYFGSYSSFKYYYDNGFAG